ncbi:MAG TPA: ATP-dependent DNA helicase, partial [Streptosporangiaceae bacterium]|nr:ATP-dependent DNA helicase [Streptosporangiaceae bacterium]
ARKAVLHRGTHLQIIASAGSGKTEVVAQRFAELISSGADPAGIIAFTFTERAAQELKARISARVEERLGPGALDRLGAAFVGTIHAYCFRLLQQHVPRYETFDVLDERRLTAFLCREEPALGLKSLTGKLFASIRAFLSNLEVVENELIPVTELQEPFRGMAEKFYQLLDQFRLLTYGQLISRAVAELATPDVANAVHGILRHLIVDEYQDVNPAQEQLIRLLTGPEVELCVVGDDDQAIYQWRGSDVRNIVDFTVRHPDAHTFTITQNWRSRPRIVAAAASFARSITGRLDKEMQAKRPAAPVDVVTWAAETEAEECERIAETIQRLHQAGLPYRDIAVLVRGRVAYPALLDAFDACGVPVQPAGRTGLFARPEAQVFGKTYAWLVDHSWSPDPYGWGEVPSDEEVFAGYDSLYRLDAALSRAVRKRLSALKASVHSDERPVNLVSDFYDLLADLGVATWNPDDPLVSSRLGTLARCSSILADYESVRRRSRPDPDEPGAQRGGQDRGPWYYGNLAIYIANYAKGAYEDFDGEPDVLVDAVDLTTVHKAKGLEWRVVFVPSLTKTRFPSSKTGRPQDWLVPRHLFSPARYEGSDADERRLFYVAMTRARDWLSLSRHDRITKNRVAASPYHAEITGHRAESPLPLPSVDRIIQEEADEPVTLTFSELAAYRACGFSYRLRNLFGFQPFLAPELGYGKAVHHILRAIAEYTVHHGRPPSFQEVWQMLDEGFFLPAASKPAHRLLKESARHLLHSYLTEYDDDLRRIWETERPFELHLPTAIITGRADVILDKEGGEVTSLAIVDYKTSTDPHAAEDYELQLAVYTDAGLREGLNVRAAYIHDLKAADRQPVDVSPDAIAATEQAVADSVHRLRNREFTARPGRPCKRCDVRRLCQWNAEAAAAQRPVPREVGH